MRRQVYFLRALALVLLAYLPARAQFAQLGPPFSGTAADGAGLAAVAISSDGTTAVVGGAGDGGGVGATFVFVRSGGGWVQQDKLIGAHTGNSSQGTSVAISADGNTAVVGGPGDNGNIGAVWVFKRTGGVWDGGTKIVGA